MADQLNLQALAALEKANEIRFARARDKRAIARGDLDPTLVLMATPKHWLSAPVIMLLVSMDRIGRKRALVWLNVTGTSPSAQIGALTERQRTQLSRQIDIWSRRRDDVRMGLEGR